MGSFFVRRPIVAMVISIVTVLVGLVSMTRLPIAQFPNIVPPMIMITGNYTGADALTVEQSVATPVEQKVNGVEGMMYMQSTNSSDGKMGLNVSFEVGRDIDIANVLTQTRVNEATPQLPADVKQTGVSLKKSFAMPMIVISLYSPNGTYDAGFLNNYAVININNDLARIPGIGRVDTVGSSDYAMRIWVRPDRLARLGLTVGDVRNALQEDPQPSIFVPHAQQPTGSLFFTVHTVGDPGTIVRAVQQEIWAMNPAMPFASVTTLDGLFDESLRDRRSMLLLVSAFSVLALALAAVGAYGLVSHEASRRSHEIGIRVAIGASRRRVGRLPPPAG